MTITDFKTLRAKLESEMNVAVLIASTFQYGYWKNYHAAVYRVVSITEKVCHLQNANHEKEWLDLDAKMLNTGQFRVEF